MRKDIKGHAPKVSPDENESRPTKCRRPPMRFSEVYALLEDVLHCAMVPVWRRCVDSVSAVGRIKYIAVEYLHSAFRVVDCSGYKEVSRYVAREQATMYTYCMGRIQ
jgi:hypothetical protein